LRLLGSNFVDPNGIDAKQHWQDSQRNPNSTATWDFTIAKNAAGLMTIDETGTLRDTSGARPQTSEITGTVGYDFNRTLPTSVDEYSILHSEQGERYETVKTETVLRLQSDSSAKP
ncbi:MAG TPA: hypothetical protein VJP76_09020, partial [Candidatus Tumulicola sp.]|nr:hypothetical protein [Candidatus Tumulicola sp.]